MLNELRRPEYTGPNRCLPCTAVNALIALTVAAAVVFLGQATGLGPGPAGGLGAIVLSVSAALIYLRGYLVPGTPRLTKTYFPDWLLARFDEGSDTLPVAGELDIEALLLDAGVAVDDPGIGDVRLTEDFEAAWWEGIDALRRDGGVEAELAAFLDVAPAQLTVIDHSMGYDARIDRARVGRWESRTAALADMAAAPELRERVPSWSAIDVQRRSSVLHGLRIFLEACPNCGGGLDFTERERLVGCCRLVDVEVLTCRDCGAAVCELD